MKNWNGEWWRNKQQIVEKGKVNKKSSTINYKNLNMKITIEVKSEKEVGRIERREVKKKQAKKEREN